MGFLSALLTKFKGDHSGKCILKTGTETWCGKQGSSATAFYDADHARIAEINIGRSLTCAGCMAEIDRKHC